MFQTPFKQGRLKHNVYDSSDCPSIDTLNSPETAHFGV